MVRFIRSPKPSVLEEVAALVVITKVSFTLLVTVINLVTLSPGIRLVSPNNGVWLKVISAIVPAFAENGINANNIAVMIAARFKMNFGLDIFVIGH